MRIVTPSIEVVSLSVFMGEFDTDARMGEKVAEFGGRACYQSFTKRRPGGAEAYFGNVMGKGHGSILEHATASLYVQGVSRSLTHELIRHRAGFGFSELSQRFVDMTNPGIVLPPNATEEDLMVIIPAAEAAIAAYNKIPGSCKQRREIARCVLPSLVETKILVTGNARAWRHFIALRGAEDADAEIRRLACLVCEELKRWWPNILQDCEVVNGTVLQKWNKV